MTNKLTIKEQEVFNTLPDNFKPYVLARQDITGAVKTFKPVFLKKQLSEILSNASYEMNSPVFTNSDSLMQHTESLFNELNFKFGTLTLLEIKNAFKMGVRGDFGQFFGMCPKTYHQFIKGYFESAERFKAQEQYLKLSNSKDVAEDKSLPPNPEGQKKVIEIFKQIADRPINYSKQLVPEKIRKPIVKSERDIFIQGCFREFFELHKKKAIRNPNGNETRFIMFKGKEVDETEYTQIKLKEYDLTKTNN